MKILFDWFSNTILLYWTYLMHVDIILSMMLSWVDGCLSWYIYSIILHPYLRKRLLIWNLLFMRVIIWPLGIVWRNSYAILIILVLILIVIVWISSCRIARWRNVNNVGKSFLLSQLKGIVGGVDRFFVHHAVKMIMIKRNDCWLLLLLGRIIFVINVEDLMVKSHRRCICCNNLKMELNLIWLSILRYSVFYVFLIDLSFLCFLTFVVPRFYVWFNLIVYSWAIRQRRRPQEHYTTLCLGWLVPLVVLLDWILEY